MPQNEASLACPKRQVRAAGAMVLRFWKRFAGLQRQWRGAAVVLFAAMVCAATGGAVSAQAQEQAALTIRLSQDGDVNQIRIGMTFRPGFKISTLTAPNRIGCRLSRD